MGGDVQCGKVVLDARGAVWIGEGMIAGCLPCQPTGQHQCIISVGCQTTRKAFPRTSQVTCYRAGFQPAVRLPPLSIFRAWELGAHFGSTKLPVELAAVANEKHSVRKTDQSVWLYEQQAQKKQSHNCPRLPGMPCLARERKMRTISVELDRPAMIAAMRAGGWHQHSH